jgi:hypothetical protein
VTVTADPADPNIVLLEAGDRLVESRPASEVLTFIPFYSPPTADDKAGLMTENLVLVRPGTNQCCGSCICDDHGCSCTDCQPGSCGGHETDASLL